jgi:hypothetical protein
LEQFPIFENLTNNFCYILGLKFDQKTTKLH